MQSWKKKMKKTNFNFEQKQPSRVGLIKRYSENMQQLYRRTPIPKLNLSNKGCKATLMKSHYGNSYRTPVDLLHNFRTSFPKSTSRGLLLCSTFVLPLFWLLTLVNPEWTKTTVVPGYKKDILAPYKNLSTNLIITISQNNLWVSRLDQRCVPWHIQYF